MHKIIRNTTLVGCLLLPLGSFGAESTNKEAKVYRHLEAKIKKAVAKDEALHPASRNIDVMVRSGVIALKGVVQSDAEAQEILGKAESVVIQKTPPERINSPEFKFDNELVVAPQ